MKYNLDVFYFLNSLIFLSNGCVATCNLEIGSFPSITFPMSTAATLPNSTPH